MTQTLTSSSAVDRAAHAFRSVFRGRTNFITPWIIERGTRGQYCYEIARGTGLDHEPIYGVTVVLAKAGKPAERTNLGKCCDSYKEAREYVDSGFRRSLPATN